MKSHEIAEQLDETLQDDGSAEIYEIWEVIKEI